MSLGNKLLKYQEDVYYINQPPKLRLVINNTPNINRCTAQNTKISISCRRAESVDWHTTHLGRW